MTPQAETKPALTHPAETNQATLSPALQQLLKQGWDLYDKHQKEAAHGTFESALALARNEKSVWGEGEAHRGLGLLAMEAANYPAAEAEFAQALALFESLPAPASVAQVLLHSGKVASLMGKRTESAAHLHKALSAYEAAGDLRGEALVFLNLNHNEGISAEEQNANRERGLNLARQLGDKKLEGAFLHDWGDKLFMAGDFAGAVEKLALAAACFEEAGDRPALARLWTSMGRLHRAQGAPQEAIPYYEKGLLIQQEIGDQIGVIQSLNAMAISYGLSGHGQEEMRYYDRALALARETGSPRVIAFMTGNVGGAYQARGENKRAIELLEESLRLDPASIYTGYRYISLSAAYLGTKQYERALDSANEAIRLIRPGHNPEILFQALQGRAHVYQKLESFPQALADIEEAIQVAEQLRGHLVPADYLKQGYAARTQDLFTDAIAIHERQGEHKEAMVAAEQARARAFLDLLAARGKEAKCSQPVTSAAGSSPPSEAAQKAGSVALVTRGPRSLKSGILTEASVLPSPTSAPPPSMEEMVATAKRLESTVLSYWVAPEATFVWVLRPDGNVRGERIAVTAERLSKLIRATLAEEDIPAGRQPAQGQTNVAAAPATHAPATMTLRGGGQLVLGDGRKRAWRELYRLLIQPVRASLPVRGSRLTIVPQGALFRLSFAALKNPQGRYLIEDYVLSYGPSLGVLRLTGDRRQRLGRRKPHYLIVADPQISSHLATETYLPPLPGARREALALARVLPAGETSVLLGTSATLQAVREQALGNTVLHLATHAIVHDDQPLGSFLALSGEGKSAADDGRLTVQDIYGIDLQADLVVLSACRTALGKLSGDGMLGLTRAFFYGGSTSVVATLWDVADEPTSRLISSFYASLLKNSDKSRALRSAQLRLLRALRAGRVHVETAAGPLTLPEDPAFWAGFVLQGEP